MYARMCAGIADVRVKKLCIGIANVCANKDVCIKIKMCAAAGVGFPDPAADFLEVLIYISNRRGELFPYQGDNSPLRSDAIL